MGMIGVLEITLIVPTLRVGMPPRTLGVRSRMWRRCVAKLQRYPRHALGSLNPQSASPMSRHAMILIRSNSSPRLRSHVQSSSP